MEDFEYIVYVKTDAQNRITDVNSSEFIPDTSGWIEIDRGNGDKYHHAQGHYFPMSLMTDEGVWRYKLDNGAAVERTAEEIAEDIALLPPPAPTKEDQLQAQIDALTIALLEV